MRKSFFGLLTLVCAFCVLGDEYYQAPRVRHDPFQKPIIPQKKIEVPVEVVTAPSQQPWAPQLKATLRSGQNSMANVNGKVIKLGESINGYQLIEVHEKSVILVKNKQHLQLTIEYEPNK
jgi:hypothetical protein